MMTGWVSGQAYSQDLRDRVLDDDASSAEVAERFGVSKSYVIKARQRLHRLGDASPGAQRSRTPPKLAGHEEALRARVAEQADATLAELRAWLLRERSVSVSLSNLSVRLRKLGLTLKKSRSPQPSRTAPTWPRRGAPGAS